MVRPTVRRALSTALAATAVLAASACGSDPDASVQQDGRVLVVATTTILGDLASNVLCDGLAEVRTVLPSGADAHSFEPTPQDAEGLRSADLLVANGLGLEAGLLDDVEAAEQAGVPVFNATDHVDLLEPNGESEAESEHESEAESGHEPEAESEHESDRGDEHGHGADPHFWFDPVRVADVARALGRTVAEATDLDPEAVEACAEAYAARLVALDAELRETFAAVPAARRVLVTNHESLGYLADRYGFEVVGTVVPSLTTMGEANPADLEELADAVADAGVPAIFAETSSSTELADRLADLAGPDVQVVELHTESLGEAGSDAATLVGMLQVDARRIADALSG